MNFKNSAFDFMQDKLEWSFLLISTHLAYLCNVSVPLVKSHQDTPIYPVHLWDAAFTPTVEHHWRGFVLSEGRRNNCVRRYHA